MADSIEKLLDKPSEQWTLDELKAGFVAALHKLNQANTLIENYESLIEEQSNLIGVMNSCDRLSRSTIEGYKTALQLQPEKSKKKGVGRPSKHHDLSWLYQWWIEARTKYGKLHDRPLIRKAFGDILKENGMRQSRLDSIEMRSKLETLRKLVSEARIQAKQKAKRLSEN